jgi:hypothetical protein
MAATDPAGDLRLDTEVILGQIRLPQGIGSECLISGPNPRRNMAREGIGDRRREPRVIEPS